MSTPGWEDEVEGARWVPAVVRPEMPDVVARALGAGARPPLAYIGAGMTAVVLCDADRAGWKIARRTGATLRRMLDREAAFLRAAQADPWARRRVARFFAWHPEAVAIERECVEVKVSQRDETPYRYGEGRLWDLHRQLADRMERYGFTAPEFKPDSWVITRRGPVLVDAGMTHYTGRRLVAEALDVVSGRAAAWHEAPADIAWAIRADALDGRIPKHVARGVIDRLAALDSAASEWRIRSNPGQDSRRIDAACKSVAARGAAMRWRWCRRADQEHARSSRQYMHTFCEGDPAGSSSQTVCVARAAMRLPWSLLVGLFAHEAGHLLRGPEASEHEADVAGGRLLGLGRGLQYDPHTGVQMTGRGVSRREALRAHGGATLIVRE